MKLAWLPILALLAAVSGARAQLSPGTLARAHADLEGLRNCTQCHQLGSGVVESRCLACHGALEARLAAGAGFHSGADVRTGTCAGCHSDHHGLDFEMIHWEGGQEAFDHRRSGWPLEGAHDALACDDCHRTELLPADWLAQHAEVDAESTFLGLPTDCAACHADEHRGQFAREGRSDCARCHDQTAWSPASGFDHADAAYPLEGAHRDVDCAACHETQARPLADDGFRVDASTEDDRFARYRGLAFDRCLDCHKDPHEGTLGSDCGSCHTTSGFATDGGFDHDRTRWPLVGAHRTATCEACHRGAGGETRLRPAFQRCSACHADEHAGQFAGRGAGDDCATCHDQQRFSPALFGSQEHAMSAWPLAGAHRAVACVDCHLRAEDTGVVRWAGLATDCEACHANPHGEEIPRQSPDADDRCLACHGVDDWSAADYDHGQARFALEGRHARLACAACHRAEQDANVVRLKPLPLACAGCHADEHAGQLERDGTTACERCHGPADWSAPRFDHGRDSAFALDGEHDGLDCSACHGLERIDGKERRRWRPLGTRCSDCHGSAAP